jgi:hypothetical protein
MADPANPNPPVINSGSVPPLPEPEASAVATPNPAAGAPLPSEPHPSEVPTLLEKLIAPGKETAGAEGAPAEAPAAPEAKEPPTSPASPEAAASAEKEASPPEPPAATPPDYSKLKLPEGFTANDERMGKFTSLLDDAKTTPSERAQNLLNLAGDVMTEWATNAQKDMLVNQIKTFNATRSEWQKKIMADPVLGGAGYDTAMGVVARMRDLFVSSSDYGSDGYNADMKEFVDFLRVTGAGDHPAFHRFLHNVGRAFDEPAPPPPNFKPPADLGRKPKGSLRDLYKQS